MRWAPIAVGLLFLASALVWLGNDRLAPRHGYGPGSSLSTAPDGLALARAYLASQGTDVGTLARPISRHEPAADAVVFRVLGPPRPRQCGNHPCPDAGSALDEDDDDEDAEDGAPSVSVAPDAGPPPVFRHGLLSEDDERFVAAGGRLVLGVPQPAVARPMGEERVFQLLPRASGRLVMVRPGVAAPRREDTAFFRPVEKVFPLLPDVLELDPEGAAALTGSSLEDAVAVFERGSAPVLARRTLGQGDVWLLGAPDVLFNARLGRADHLGLLVALAGGGRPVLFDESVHGLLDRPGVLDLLRRWGFGPALFLLALAGCVWFWRRAVTLGPPSPWRDVRTESVDLVQAVAQLYQRALRPQDALALHHCRLVHDIQLRFGLGLEAATERASLLTDGWQLPNATGPMSKSEFQRHLDILNRAIRRLRDDRPRRT